MKKIIISLVVIVAVAAVAYYFYGFKNDNSVADYTNNNITQTTQLPAPQAQLDTSNWQTYSDQYLSFKYPADWKITVGYENDNQSTILNISDKNNQYYIENSVAVPITIIYGSDTFKGNINDFLVKDNYTNSYQGITTIGEKNAYVIANHNSPGQFELRVVFNNASIFKFNSNISQLDINDDQRTKLNNDFETILSSVQFK